MNESNLIFNTVTRQYEIWHHETIIHQYDYTERKIAHRHHIQLADPNLYKAANYLASDLFRHNPDMTDRIWSAARIVMQSGVRPPYYLSDDLNTYRVKDLAPSPPRAKTYHYPVTKTENRYGCDCFDFNNNPSCPTSNGQKMCEHVIAVKLQKMIHRPMQPWYIPQHASPGQVQQIMRDEAYQDKFGLPADYFDRVEAIRQRKIAETSPGGSRHNPDFDAAMQGVIERQRGWLGAIGALDRPQQPTDLIPTETEKLLYAAVLEA